MKKKTLMFALFFCMLVLSACGQEGQESQNKVPVYYLGSSETKVEMHEHGMEGATAQEQLEELLDCLSTPPSRLEYKAPLAMGFQLLDVTWKEKRLTLDVDAAYKSMPATTEVLVRAAIVKTLTQLDEVSYVEITVEGEPLFDNAGALVGWMNGEQFINNDGNDINTYELVRVKLYFATEDGTKLLGGFREKHYSTNTPLERFVVEELIAGPSGQVQGMYPAINPETKILSVMTRDGVCYVNLDSGFLTVVNNVSTEVAVYSIVNSLVELSNINKVQILVNGEVPAVFSTSTFERNLDYVTTLE